VNYNTKKLLERLLDTLHSDYEPGVWNIYISDNASTDGTREWLTENFHKYNLKYFGFNENIGYSAAINNLVALSKAGSNSEFLCAVNADTWFTTSHVKQVIESFHKTPNAAVIGVKQMDENKLIRHGGIFWDGVKNPIHRGWSMKDPFDASYKDRVPCWTVSGSIYYMRRNVWDEVAEYEPFKTLYPNLRGAWLPTPMYFEETFYSQLVQHLGYEVWYDGTVDTAGHTWNASTGSHNEKLQNLFQTSRQMYIQTCEALGIPHECN